MNLLILDVTNDSLIQPLKENEEIKVITGTVRRPKLYPIPDVILLDFDQVLGHNRREIILMELTKKLHPWVTFVACSEEWNDSTRMFAKKFGVDDCFNYSQPDRILYRINLYSQVYDAL